MKRTKFVERLDASQSKSLGALNIRLIVRDFVLTLSNRPSIVIENYDEQLQSAEVIKHDLAGEI